MLMPTQNILIDMGYVKIKVLDKGTTEDLRRWKEHMLEEPKCWNKFCLNCYEKDDLQAIYVSKEGNDSNKYVTTLCTDCISYDAYHDILVNENHLMVETQR